MVSRVLEYLFPAAVPLKDYVVSDHGDGQGDHVTYWNPAIGTQPTAQQLSDTEVSAPYVAWLANHGGDAIQTSRLAAKQAIQSTLRECHIVDRAVAEAARDEINALRQWITDFKAAVNAATTLANLKTGVAALPNMPQRTLPQLKTVIETKIDLGIAD